jgi:NAD(P)-dependent dehydrogenase (short-subunit alcohol dehydrogenase family)
MELNGQVALVTGAASGLGAQTARELAGRGARVAVLDTNIDRAREVANEIRGEAYACDIASADSAQSVFAQVRQALGAARVLVNCAGIAGGARIVGRTGPMPLEDFARIVQVNLIGTFNMMRLAAADMAQLEPLQDGERGVIVSTASIAAYEGQIGQAAYAASKGGIVSLTLPAARELAQFGIRVVTIAPGLFLTPLLHQLPPETRQSLGDSIPFPRRLGKPEEFAQLVAHIVTNVALNGEVIRLDGALRMTPR